MSERENRDPAWIHTSKEFLPTRLSQKPLVNELSPAGSTQKSLANELPPAGLTKKSLANELPSTGLIQRPLADDVPPLKSQSWVSKISDFFSSSTGKTTATLGAILVAVVVILMAVAEYNHRPGKKSDIKFSTPFSLWEESKRFTFASGSGTFIIPDQWEKINKYEGPIPFEPIYSIKDELISPDKQTLNNNLLNIFYVQPDEQKYPTGVIIIKYDGNKLLTYNPHTPINTNDIENILHIDPLLGGSGLQQLLSQLPPNSPLKNIQIPDLSQKSTAEQIKLVEEFKTKINVFLPPEFQQLKIPHTEAEIPAFLQNIKSALDKYNMSDLFGQFIPKMKGGQVDNLMTSTQTARKASTMEEASKVVCAEDEKFKSYLLKSDSAWICKDAACKEWSIKTADGVKDVDQGILDAQCGVMGLASGCESTLRNCATGDINNCFDTLVKVGNKFGGYGCGEKRDAIMKVSPGLVRDILAHLGFKTKFRRDVSHGIDLLAFESLSEYIAHSTDALRIRLESPLYNNLTSFLRLMIEWANAHPEMLNDALVKSNIKVAQASPLSQFTLKEKSIIPGTEKGDLRSIIGELTRLGYQQGGTSGLLTRSSVSRGGTSGLLTQSSVSRGSMSALELSHYFRDISSFTQKLNTNTINDIRMGRTSVQSGGSLTAESVLGTLKYRSTADSSIFSAIIDEVIKMLNMRYNIDLSTKSQQRIQEKLEAFKVAERALFDSMTEALERERVLKATGQQIDIDNVTNDAERQRLIQHYAGMSKLLDEKNKQASKLITAIQTMLKAGLDYQK